jgi:hypothetical protein
MFLATFSGMRNLPLSVQAVVAGEFYRSEMRAIIVR